MGYGRRGRRRSRRIAQEAKKNLCAVSCVQKTPSFQEELSSRKEKSGQGVSSRRRSLTRRAFVGAGGLAALGLLTGSRLAWAGVGGGGWGAVGGVAQPGARFGYDAGWSYSYDGCVWLATSCNCTVGRMTELFLEIRVDAYVACGGIWNPTWSPDMPDTPTYAYIRNDAGTWLASAYWIIDTTYDHDYYVYMTGAALRVSRQTANWRCWCGSDIKGLGGNAPGTHSIAEASQQIPRHVLINDTAWQKKIVTIRSRSASKLFVDAAAGGIAGGTNVLGWSATHTTNQNWIVLKSSQGRTCFVPVHTGAAPLFLDIADAVWDDGANVKLWTGNGSPAQSYWLHRLESGHHLLIPECSGCAVTLGGDGKTDGSNIAQWNCYGNWNKTTQHWKLEEVVFREAVGGSTKITGSLKTGSTLSISDPDKTCLPRNYPRTTGMVYRYVWYRGATKGARSKVIRALSEDPRYRVVEADEGSYLTCVITAHTRYQSIPYRGEVAIPSALVPRSKVGVKFFVDSEKTACYQVEARKDAVFSVPQAAVSAALKADCAGLEGWFIDAECKTRFVNGSVVSQDMNLFAFNKVRLTYGMADTSYVLVKDRLFFTNKQLSVPLTSIQSLLPAAQVYRFGQTVSFARGAPVWFEDKASVREVVCLMGAYSDAKAEGTAAKTARLVRNTTVYLKWDTPRYEGIELS